MAGLLELLMGQRNNNTPGINPNEPNPHTQNQGLIGKTDGFLNSDGGSLLFNLLAQQGFSTIPQSPLGALGRAGVETQQQKQARERSLLENQLLQARTKLANAQANAAPQVDEPKPQTDIGKLVTDRRNGFITDEQLNTQLASLNDKAFGSVQERTSKLRSQYRTDSQGIRDSITDLAKAKSLLERGGPISDTAAFTSFIRSIDNSVVRPAEQAAYSRAGGAARAFEDMISKVAGKGPLSDATRADLLGAINAIDSELRGINDRTAEFYGGLAEKVKLDPEDVIGIPLAKKKDITLQSSKGGSTETPEMTRAAKSDPAMTQELWNAMTPEERELWGD